MSCGVPSTLTVSLNWPTASCASSRSVCDTCSVTLSRMYVLKPASSNFTVYVPTGRLGTVYCPASLVTAVWTMPLAPVIVTVTPGIAALDGSVTAPEMVARFTCAAAGVPATETHARTTTPSQCFAVIGGPPDRGYCTRSKHVSTQRQNDHTNSFGRYSGASSKTGTFPVARSYKRSWLARAALQSGS